MFYNGGISINGWSIRQSAAGDFKWDFGVTPNYEVTVMGEGPTAFFKFEEASGTVIADSSGNGNTGTLQSAAGLTYSVPGVNGNAFTFATNAYVQVGPLSFAAGNPQYTVSAWIQTPLPADGNWKTVIRGNGGDHHMIFNNSTNEFGSYFNSMGGFTGSGVLANSLTAGFHLFTIVGTNSSTSYYVDGAFANTTSRFSSTDIYAIGNYQSGGQPAGTVDGVAIWMRALSANEISAQFAGTCSVNLQQGYWAQISGIFNGTTIQLYKNGNQVCQAVPQGYQPNSGLNPSFGAKPNGNNAWPGEMADFRVYTSLTPTDVGTNFTTTKDRYLSGPASISNLAYWVDATDPANTGAVPANGATVSVWRDKSGNNNDLTSSGTTPTFVQSGLGASLPAIYYGGAGAHLSNVTLSGPYTIAMVSRLEGSLNQRVLGDYTGQNILFGYWGNKMHGFYINGSPENLFGSTSPVAVAAAAIKNSYIFTRSGASGTFSFYNNGTLYASNGSSNSANFKLELGCGSGPVGECSKVYISELIVYTRAISASELATLNTYLATRWGF